MKILNKLSIISVAILAGIVLSSCGKDNNSSNTNNTTTSQTQNQTSTSQQSPATSTPASMPVTAMAPKVVDNNVYVAKFDSTKARLEAYLNPKYNFNDQLPLRANFTALLNNLSNSEYYVQEHKLTGLDLQLADLQVLEGLYKQFNAIIANYQKDPSASAKLLSQAGLNINLDNANLTTLLNQLNSGCVSNNDYQMDINTITSNLIIKVDGKQVPFPQTQIDQLNQWNNNFTNACNLTSRLYSIVNTPKFSYDNLPTMISNLETQIKNNTK